MNKFILSILIIACYSCRSGKEQKSEGHLVIGYGAKVEFLNDIKRSFTKININGYKNVSFKTYDLRFVDAFGEKLKKIKTALKAEDYEFLMSQINEYETLEMENFEVDFKIKGFDDISRNELRGLGNTYDSLWSNFRKKYGEKSLLILSKPLLSKDLSIAIMEIQVISESDTNSKNALYAFKKVDGQWMQLSEL